MQSLPKAKPKADRPGPPVRPAKLSPDVRQRLLDGFRLPLTHDDVARLAGVSPRTLALWLAKGRKETSGEYYDLLQAVELSKAQGKALLVNRVIAATRTNAELALKVLARRYPREWGPSAALTVETRPAPDMAEVRARLARRLDEYEARLALAADLERRVHESHASNTSAPREIVPAPDLRRIASAIGSDDDARAVIRQRVRDITRPDDDSAAP